MSDDSAGVSVVPKTRWFISAGTDVDLSGLISDLRRRGAEPYVLSDVAELGADVLQSVSQAIVGADYVLLVLGTGSVSSNVIFEAGMAVGLGKPLLVVASPGIKLPSDLASVLTVRADPGDLGAIGFALDQAQGRAARRAHAAAATGRSLGSRVDDLLARLTAEEPISEREAIEVLKDALEESGVIAAEGLGDDNRFDLGVWSDDLDAIAANPLLIEVKKTLRAGSVEQVLNLLAANPTARAALLVFLNPVSREQLERASRTGYPVLVITFRDLLERMRSASFAEVVRTLRNRSVHGLPL
jgi:hypothetical protein